MPTMDAEPDVLSTHITGESEAVDSLVEIEIDDAWGGCFVVLDAGTTASIDCT